MSPLQQAQHYFKLGQYDKAQTLCKSILLSTPNNVDALNLLGIIEANKNNFTSAIKHFKRAVKLTPRDALALRNLGRALLLGNKAKEAIKQLKLALKFKPDYADAAMDLARALDKTGQHTDSNKMFQKVIELQPDNAIAHSNLADIQRKVGDIAGAITSYQKSLQLNPRFHNSYLALVNCKRFTDNKEIIATMESLRLDSTITLEQKYYLDFALAKSYEDSGEYDKSFHYLAEGNRLLRNTYDYHVKHDIITHRYMSSVFTDELFSAMKNSGSQSRRPVFIIGMPRSGTTLVEQILASHPEAHGIGESYAMLDTLKEFDLETLDSSRHDIEQINPGNLLALGKRYIKKISLLSPSSRFIVNKLPHNYLILGFIKLALPNAIIIHCRRNPMDTCFSLYKHFFNTPHKYAQDLIELGQYYNAYDKLMQHWASTIPGGMLEFSYEQLISDQDKQIKRLLDYCNLEWNQSCLEFYKNSRAVTSTSVSQVREPLYQHSVKLWKKYERQLQLLFATLDAQLQQQSL